LALLPSLALPLLVVVLSLSVVPVAVLVAWATLAATGLEPSMPQISPTITPTQTLRRQSL
jgi:hypothetical protein